MALSVTHTFVSAIPDDADASLVRPSNWNAAHALSGVLPVANGGTGITSFGTGIDTFLGTPTSANLAAAVTDETGTGALVFANTPTFVTPILGTPTSGNLANCTGYPVGSISGTVPATAGGTGLTSYAVGDIIYAATTTTLAKLADVATGNALISGGVSTAPSWGKIALATAVSGNLPVTNLNSGTNADNTHFWRGDGTWAVPASGGTPGGSSLTVQYNNASAFGGMSGTSWDDTNRSLTMTGATVTTSNPVLNLTQTWNAGAVTFTGINLAITKTAGVVGSPAINITQDGQVLLQAYRESAFSVGCVRSDVFFATNDIRIMRNGASIFFGTGASTSGSYTNQADITSGNFNLSTAAGQFRINTDTILSRAAAATLQFGAADAAAAVAQTTQVQSVVAGTSNTAGADWTFNASKGTGTGAGGNFIFQCAPVGTTGTAQNALAQVFKISGGGAAGNASPSIQVGSGSTTNAGWILGYANFSGGAGIWTTDVTPSGTNYSFLATANSTIINAPNSGDSMNLRFANSNAVTITSSVFQLAAGVGISFGNVAFINEPASATIQHGAADAAVAVAQTISVQSVSAGTSGAAGALWTFQGSRSTGTAAGGDIAFFLSPNPGIAAATTQNTAVEHHRLLAAGNFKFTHAANFSANGSVATVLGSLGPTGAQTTVQKWLTFVDNGGTTRYVPCF